MARCSGRLLCICLLPCVMVGHLIVYIMVSICITISYSPPLLPVRFVAPGTSSNSGALAAHPLYPFWNLRLEEGALWNQLQHLLDRQHNPILRGNRTWGKQPNAEDVLIQGEGESSQGSPDCLPDQRWASRLQDFNTFPEQMQQFVLSMHCREYPLLTDQPYICGKPGQEAPMLLLAIKSETGNFENRQAIRQTWGRAGWVQGEAGGKGGLVRTVFLLGKQDPSTGLYPDLGALLEVEKSQHQDILQWDFRDSFFNLTLKDVLFWRWFSLNCPHARFVFKGDDDVFVRTRSLLDYLHQQEEQENGGPGQNRTEKTRDLFVGEVIANAGPNRQPSTKYYIPESFYKGVYPAYAGGGGVVYSGDLALRLGQVSKRVHLFPIDDVYLGMCLHRLGISPSHHPGFLTFDLPASERDKPCAYRSVILVHKRSPKEMLRLWSELQTVPPPC